MLFLAWVRPLVYSALYFITQSWLNSRFCLPVTAAEFQRLAGHLPQGALLSLHKQLRRCGFLKAIFEPVHFSGLWVPWNCRPNIISLLKTEHMVWDLECFPVCHVESAERKWRRCRKWDWIDFSLTTTLFLQFPISCHLLTTWPNDAPPHNYYLLSTI